MQTSLITRVCLLSLLCATLVLTVEDEQPPQHLRSKRALFGKNGFFPTLFSVVYEQWTDTKNTIGSVNKMINDNFLDENAPAVVLQETNNADPNATTTEAPYRITRKEFNKIVRRNLRGIQRLLRIELKDAMKQSEETQREFRKNASIEVSKFL